MAIYRDIACTLHGRCESKRFVRKRWLQKAALKLLTTLKDLKEPQNGEEEEEDEGKIKRKTSGPARRQM